MRAAVRLLRPCVGWPRVLPSLRQDLVAAAAGALIAFPQAIALAALAGLPPQYGFYTSILPVMIAVIWGASWFLASGPNTAVSLMIAGAVPAIIALEPSYSHLEVVLLLTLLVGSIQLLTGLVHAGSLLDFVSDTVIAGTTFAVGLVMIVSAVLALLQVPVPPASGFFPRLTQLLGGLRGVDLAVAQVGLVAVAGGLLTRLLAPRYALLATLISGALAVVVLQHLAPASAAANTPLLGTLPLTFPAFSVPPVDGRIGGVAGDLAGSALAIAFVGLMQSVVIARSLATRSGQAVDANRECVGQGMANLVAPFVSAFAGSGSFNRSAAHHALGARSPQALLYAPVLLLGLLLVGDRWLALVPQAAVAATLLLAGFSLLDWRALRKLRRSREELLIFGAVLGIALILGLSAGVLAGVLLSLAIYLSRTSAPGLREWHFVARDGRPVRALQIDGNLFFGSVARVQKQLPTPPGNGQAGILLIDTHHLTFLDHAGGELLLRTVRDWRQAGGEACIRVDRPAFLQVLSDTDLLGEIGQDCLASRQVPHPLAHLLEIGFPDNLSHTSKEEPSMEALARQLHAQPLLGPVPFDRLLDLLRDSPVLAARRGDIVVQPHEGLQDHLVVLDGELDAERTWETADGTERSHTWRLRAHDDRGKPAMLTAASRRLRVRAVTDCRYLRLDAAVVDDLLGWDLSALGCNDAPPGASLSLLRQVGIFHQIPLERICEALRRLQPQPVGAGETVIREGDRGDRYYLIEDGEAEVIRSDPLSGETRVTDTMGPGDGFGEEALLQDGFRNATIRMLTPGRLLYLSHEDFAGLIRPSMVDEVGPEEAKRLLEEAQYRLLDCRYDMEYEESRIPGARLIPLHLLRFQVHELDPDARYVVYCRSGRRSKAAAFLLRERNIEAVSLAGGIKDWPYALEVPDAVPD